MKQPSNESNAQRHDNDPLRQTAKRFVKLAFDHFTPKTELDGTAKIAAEAIEELEREQARAKRASEATGEEVKPQHISNVSIEGSLRNLGRALSRSESFDNDDHDGGEMSPDDVLEKIVQAIRDRQAGK